MVKVKGTSSEFIRDMYDVGDQHRVQVWSSKVTTFTLHKHLQTVMTNLTLKVKVISFKLVQNLLMINEQFVCKH